VLRYALALFVPAVLQKDKRSFLPIDTFGRYATEIEFAQSEGA